MWSLKAGQYEDSCCWRQCTAVVFLGSCPNPHPTDKQACQMDEHLMRALTHKMGVHVIQLDVLKTSNLSHWTNKTILGECGALYGQLLLEIVRPNADMRA